MLVEHPIVTAQKRRGITPLRLVGGNRFLQAAAGPLCGR
jgi:hypothetical protein